MYKVPSAVLSINTSMLKMCSKCQTANKTTTRHATTASQSCLYLPWLPKAWFT